MIDKTAIINAAQKHASKGNIDMAIAEWEKLLANGKDGNVQNTIGDLCMKKGAQEQAVEAFEKAAEIFRQNGFYPKAIAIYKKILNIQPNRVESVIALAKLNAEKGLNASAADYYFKAAELFHRSGSTAKGTMAVEKILTLSTVDMKTREKIAEWYIRTGMKPSAANEYAAIALSYLEKDDTVNAEKFFTTAAEHDPDNISSFIGLSRLAEKTDNIEQAFTHLENAISLDSHNRDSLLAYSELAIRHNRIDDAKNTLLDMIERNPSYNQPRRLLAGLYLDENKLEKAWEQLLPCINEAIEDKKWEDAVELLDKFRELHPVPVRERIIEVYRSAKDSENLAKETMELASLYQGQGSSDDALRLYRELLESDPDNTEIAGRINELEPAVRPAFEAEVEKIVPQNEPEINDTPLSETLLEEKVEADFYAKQEINELEPAVQPASGSEVEKVVPQNEPEINDTPLPETLLEKKVEADFYAKQGMNEEAEKLYKEILSAAPDNQGIKKKLEGIQSVSGQSEEVVVKKIHDGEAETKDELDASSIPQDLQGIFDEFSKDEDYEARYKAGLECKRQGHLDDAIKEFGVAAGDPEKKLVCRSMIALCYMEKGSYADAVTEFNKVLESMSPGDASYLRIKYELAGAYKEDGNDKKAFELYSEIKEQDPEFKDVSKEIEELRPAAEMPTAEIPATEESKLKKKKSRVSYI